MKLFESIEKRIKKLEELEKKAFKYRRLKKALIAFHTCQERKNEGNE